MDPVSSRAQPSVKSPIENSAGTPNSALGEFSGRARSLVVRRFAGRASEGAESLRQRILSIFGRARLTQPEGPRVMENGLWKSVFSNKVIADVIFRHLRTASATSCANLIRELAAQHRGNPAEFKGTLKRMISKDGIRQLGVNFKGLDDQQKMDVLDVIETLNPELCDSIELQGFLWDTGISGSRGWGPLNARLQGFLRSDIACMKLTSLAMEFWLLTTRGSPDPELISGLKALRKIDFVCGSSNGRCVALYKPWQPLDEVRLDFAFPNGPHRNLVTLKPVYERASRLILQGHCTFELTDRHLTLIAEANPAEVIIIAKNAPAPELVAAAKASGLKVSFIQS